MANQFQVIKTFQAINKFPSDSSVVLQSIRGIWSRCGI